VTGLILAWLCGEGIMAYRTVTQHHRPPLPGEVLGTSGAFVLLGLLAEVQPAFAQLLAWGLVSAALLNLWPTNAASTAEDTGGGDVKKAPAKS